MKWFPYLPMFGLALIGGCANWNTVYRTIDLGHQDSSPRGVALDVKTRAILTAPRKTVNGSGVTENVTCPEASPDALSATSISAALSGTLDRPTGTSPTEAQLKAAAAIAEGAASIGLRTQSIQLMRDGLVFNCILFMNGAVTPGEAYLLQRRSQNFTLGLLAIEQLTGPVKAQQAALTAQGSSSVGQTNIDKEAAALGAAEAKHASAKAAHAQGKAELTKLVEEQTEQKTKTDAAETDYKAAVTAAGGKPADSAEKKLEQDKLTTFTAEKKALTAKSDEVVRKRIDIDKLDLDEKSALKQVSIADDALKDAQSRVRASTNATAVLAASGGGGVIITDRIASSVVEIVKAVLVESGSGEACNSAVAALLTPGQELDVTGTAETILKWACPKEIQDAVKKDPVAKQNFQNLQNYRSILNQNLPLRKQ